jgi:hypothetical protein
MKRHPPAPLSRRGFLAGAAGLCLAGLARNGAAAEEKRFSTMTDGMKALADQLERAIVSGGGGAVSLGPFKPQSELDQNTSFGPRIVSALTEALSASGQVNVAKAGQWKLDGQYVGERNDATGLFEIYILSQLKDARGRSKGEMLTPIITNEKEALAMIGGTVNLPTQVDEALKQQGAGLDQARAAAIEEARKEPAVSVAGSRIAVSPQSPFAIEILDLTGRPLLAASAEGQAFVEIPKGASYLVRLINDSDQDVGVALTIDGINSLAFSQNKSFRDLGMWVIGARTSGVVRGWHEVGNQSFQFNVMDIAKTPAAALGATEQVGVITATFCAAFENNLPPAELLPGLRDKVATGKGPPIEQPLREAVRLFGAVKEAVSVRYAR